MLELCDLMGADTYFWVIGALILAGAATLLLGFRFVARSDPFSFLFLTSIPIVFLLVIRPIAFVFFEDFDGRYVPQRPGIQLFVVVTLAINLFAYLLFVTGYSVGMRGEKSGGPRTATLMSQPDRIRRTKLIAVTLFVLGLIAWLYLIRQGGGLQLVLSSLEDRNNIFVVAGGLWFLEITKALISVSAILTACVFFAEGKRAKGAICILVGCVLILSFGGRGAMLSVLAGGMIGYNYLCKRIKLRTLMLVAVLMLPLLVTLGEIRQSLRGSSEISIDFNTQEASAEEKFIKFSYLMRAFDYNVVYLQKYVEEELSFIGEYPFGVTAVVPRSVYPGKSDMLGSRLAAALYEIDTYGITPSFTVGVMLYWGALAVPFFSLLLGYLGARFWRHYAGGDPRDPWRRTVYCTIWPIIPWLFFDLAGLLVAALPIVVFLMAANIFSRLSFRVSGTPATL